MKSAGTFISKSTIGGGLPPPFLIGRQLARAFHLWTYLGPFLIPFVETFVVSFWTYCLAPTLRFVAPTSRFLDQTSKVHKLDFKLTIVYDILHDNHEIFSTFSWALLEALKITRLMKTTKKQLELWTEFCDRFLTILGRNLDQIWGQTCPWLV